jgi:hypothetical protein
MENTDPDRSSYLIVAALAYTLTTTTVHLALISSMASLTALCVNLFLLPLFAISAMIVARQLVRFHWSAMFAFVCWILGTVFFQLLILDKAWASV